MAENDSKAVNQSALKLIDELNMKLAHVKAICYTTGEALQRYRHLHCVMHAAECLIEDAEACSKRLHKLVVLGGRDPDDALGRKKLALVTRVSVGKNGEGAR